jgi:hypothetical protein
VSKVLITLLLATAITASVVQSAGAAVHKPPCSPAICVPVAR